MINKQRICYLARKHYPETFGIRKMLQRKKVKRLFRFMLPKEAVKAVEQDPSKLHETIAPYLVKWSKYLKPAVAEMDYIFENAPLYAGRNQDQLLRDDILFCRLAYGFIPSEYVGFELENKSPKERRRFMSDIDTNYFGYSVNNIRILQTILDKGDCFQRFRSYFHRDGLVISSELDLPSFLAFVEKHPIFVKKAVFSCMGKGVKLVNIKKTKSSPEAYFRQLISEGKYLLEERVIQHPEMARFNNSSVNTVRCITLKTKHGVIVPYSFMRTGRGGSFVDNGGSGGLLIGIDIENGILNTDGFDELGSRYSEHPDTKVTFKGSKIPEWKSLITFCKKAAANVKEIGYLSWDLAYTESGWDVIEINEVGQLIVPQTVTKCGIRAEVFKMMKEMEKII